MLLRGAVMRGRPTSSVRREPSLLAPFFLEFGRRCCVFSLRLPAFASPLPPVVCSSLFDQSLTLMIRPVRPLYTTASARPLDLDSKPRTHR